MASAIQSSPPPAAAAAAAATSASDNGDVAASIPTRVPAPWQLAALTRPARVSAAGTTLSRAARLWLDWTLQVAAEALGRALERPVNVEIPADPQSAAAASPQVFGVAFAHPALSGGAEGLIVVDALLARAIVDALESDFANLRGNCGISDAEMGLLEYATLASVDHVLRDTTASAPDAPRAFALRGFLDAGELHERLKEQTRAPGVLKVRIAGREGLLRLYIPGWQAPDLAALALPPPPPPPAAASVNPATALTLRLALPPLSLPADEVARLQGGDVLLLGATEPQSLSDCRLVTGTGWSIASATIVRNAATLLTVRCGPFDLGVWNESAVGSAVPGHQVLTPVVGRQALTLDQLQRWQAGATLDLPKHLAAPVELYLDNQPIAAGELVRVEGELALRLLHGPTAPAAERG
ncbi:MAG TPA: FliM/FliN family flagellar motor switch protein [Tepidisphaeraceae bacterium]|jgi:hypothetical protein